MPWYLISLLSALFYAFSTFSQKKSLLKEHALPVATIYAIFAFLLSTLFIGEVESLTPHLWGLIIIKCLSFAGSWLLVAIALEKMEVSQVDPLRNTNVVILAILSYFFLGDQFTWQQVEGLLLMIVGASILEYQYSPKPQKKGKKISIWKNRFFLAYLGSLIITSISGIIDKIVLREISNYTLSFYKQLCLLIIFLSAYIIRYKGDLSPLKRNFEFNSLWTFFTAFFRLVSDLFHYYALGMYGVFVALATAIRRTSSFFAVLISGKLLHENHILQKFSATLIIFAGAALVIFK